MYYNDVGLKIPRLKDLKGMAHKLLQLHFAELMSIAR